MIMMIYHIRKTYWSLKHRTGLGPPYRVENSTGLHILGPQVMMIVILYHYWVDSRSNVFVVFFIQICIVFASFLLTGPSFRFTQLWRDRNWRWFAGSNFITLFSLGFDSFFVILIICKCPKKTKRVWKLWLNTERISFFFLSRLQTEP